MDEKSTRVSLMRFYLASGNGPSRNSTCKGITSRPVTPVTFVNNRYPDIPDTFRQLEIRLEEVHCMLMIYRFVLLYIY